MSTDSELGEPAIFLQTFELTKLVIRSTNQFPKPTRYVLGNRLEHSALELTLVLNQIVGPSGMRFLKAEKRRVALQKLSMNLDEFRLLLRMGREIGAYSAGQYHDFNQRTQSIGRQIGGLIRQTRTNK